MLVNKPLGALRVTIGLLPGLTLYAANGIWFEALSTAGYLRRRDPKDTSWAALLQAVGLNDLVNEPIVNEESCS